MSDPYIVINEYYRDSVSGHTNVSFYDGNGSLLKTIGSNANWDFNPFNSLEGGIVDETGTRTPDRTQRLDLGSSTFSNLYTYALSRIGDGPYFALGMNCVDFVIDILDHSGLQYNLRNVFQPGGKLDLYAQNVDDTINNAGNWLQMMHMQEQGGPTGPYGDIDYWIASWESLVDQNGVWENGEIVVSAYRNQYEAYLASIQQTAYSPIAIDLNGDGIQTSRLTFAESGGVRFDLDGNGTIDRVGWLSGGDAFLVHDTNGDGKITSGREMFGGAERGQGFAKLSEFDDSGDGVINALDSRFDKLMLWQDSNSNGLTDDGELLSLDSVGLTEINLSYTDLSISNNGNILGEHSNVFINGVEHLMVDVYFRADLDYLAM